MAATEKSKSGHKFYGADGNPIPNLGGQSITGVSINDKKVGMEFIVADIARPNASIGEIIDKHHRPVFDEDSSYIENKKSGAWIPMRREGDLFYLDLWCQIPTKLANNPFARQVEN